MVVTLNSASLAWKPAHGGPASITVPVSDDSQVGEARRAADMIARRCGLDEHARGELGIVVTEAATNLARHAREGVVLLRDTHASGAPGVELLAVDRGPGMRDLERFFADGFSTGGTAGAGLGAMRRQSDVLDVYSVPGQGTAVLARVFATGASQNAPPRLLDVGVVCTALAGESVCGDGWSVRQSGDRAMLLLVDGLGHGPSAAEAADTAIAAFETAGDRSPTETMRMMHEALRATRGAAVAVAEVRRTSEGASATVCGVGNTVTTMIGAAGTRALPSMNGTAGLTLRGAREFTTHWTAGETLVMHSDGITTRWQLDAYPGIRQHDPAITAAVLHRDFSRGRDDATVLAFSLRAAEQA